MTIKVYADRIEIGAKTITTTPTGIRIGDSLAANTQQQGYINQANFTARELALGAFGFQGSVSGYTSGGVASPNNYTNTIDKFPFSSDTNAGDVGDLTVGRYMVSGQSSSTHGYTSAGRGGAPENPPNPYTNIIDKFPFASDTNATDVGDTTAGKRGSAGQSSSISGYVSGGSLAPANTNVIDKFPFASNTNAVDIGDLTQSRELISGHSSSTNGYVSAGTIPPETNVIDKFPFATDTNATDVGDLSSARSSNSGQSSTTHGYASGGYQPPGPINTVDKFPFAADTNASDIGDLSQARRFPTGQSSASHGYSSGGIEPPNIVDTIDKFPFSTDTNASDVGNLSQARYAPAGQQY